MNSIRPVCVLAAFLGGMCVQAAPSPALYAEVRGIDDENHRRSLRLVALEIDVELQGAVAVSTLQAKFAGEENEDLEGHFSLALPSGSVVTGYALDVEGTMIDGVIAPKEQLREVYESTVRQGVDPGIAEVSAANIFSTKIYPIEEEGRTIRLKFATPVLNGFELPLNVESPVDVATLTVRTSSAGEPPALLLPSGMQAEWQRTANELSAIATSKKEPVSGNLQVLRRPTTSKVEINRRSTGERFFQITDSATPLPIGPTSRVRIYWDTSTSRRDDLLEREIELAADYLDLVQAPADLVLFSSAGAQRIEVVSGQALKAALSDVTYRGASSVDVLSALKLSAAERCLLVSDGHITLGRRDSFKPACAVSTVTSVTDSNRAWLSRLARTSGGQSIELHSTTVEESLRRLSSQVPIVVRATDAQGRDLSFSVVEQAADGWLVVGEAPRSGAIALHVRSSNGEVTVRMYQTTTERPFDGTAAMWARNRAYELALHNAWSSELLEFSRYFGIPNEQLSFIVLETPEDYVQAGVAPPANYPEEALNEYQEMKAEFEKAADEANSEHLSDLRERFAELKNWWAQRHAPPKAEPTAATRAGGSVGGGASPVAGGSSGGGMPSNSSTVLEEVVLSASFIQRPGIQIKMGPWLPARPYLAALDIAGDRRLDLVIAEQENLHGTLPAFYLDVAEWLHRRGLAGQAREMALSALDHALANEQTLSTVADRMLRYGELNIAVELYEQLHMQAAHRPQPKFQLAVALAQRARHVKNSKKARNDLQCALQLLKQVATEHWSEEYDGIDLIALIEANALLPRFRKLGGVDSVLAPEFTAKLDLDIRVVANWNTAGTDLDLWVHEPTGESASYGNTRTAIGGRVSNDMTNGYGPEEYLLRRALTGEYEIKVDVYSVDPINPNGPTVVTARLIRDFGRDSQREEFMDIELKPGAEDGDAVRIGVFRVGKHQ